MNIWLIRHGMTLAGEEGRYQGFLDQSLSDNGRAMLAEAPHKPSHIYVSPAKRARETASILFPDAEQICVPGLWEMNFGVFEGRTWKEMENDPQYREWVDGWCLGTCPGGESRAAFSSRVCHAFLTVLKMEEQRNGPEEDLFILSHGGTQMAILEKWGRPARDYYDWQRPCGCGWKLSFRKSAATGPGPAASESAGSESAVSAGHESMDPSGNKSKDPEGNETFELLVLEETSFVSMGTHGKE